MFCISSHDIKFLPNIEYSIQSTLKFNCLCVACIWEYHAFHLIFICTHIVAAAFPFHLQIFDNWVLNIYALTLIVPLFLHVDITWTVTLKVSPSMIFIVEFSTVRAYSWCVFKSSYFLVVFSQWKIGGNVIMNMMRLSIV